MSYQLAVVILNYKKYQDTHNCLRHLYHSDLPQRSIIYVVDNSNSSKDQLWLQSEFPKIKLIRSPKNLGFAGGNNLALKELKEKAKTILIINPDVTMPKKFFKPLLKHFDDPRVGMVAPALKHQQNDQTLYGLDGYIDWSAAKPKHHNVKTLTAKRLKKAEFLTFACILINSKVFKSIGLLDQKYFMYLEDVDFCLRARKVGYNLYLDPNIIAEHETSASFTVPTQKLKFSFKSHHRFIKKWIPFPQNIGAFIYIYIFYPYLFFLWTIQFYKKKLNLS